MVNKSRLRLALVLGSGAARGWAHIGVIHELAGIGISPDIVVGSSVGSVVAAAYASGNLDPFEKWILALGRVDIIRLLDFDRAEESIREGRQATQRQKLELEGLASNQALA